MNNKTTRGDLTDSLILQTYFDEHGRTEATLGALRSMGHTFGNKDVRKRLRDAVRQHLEAVDTNDVGSVDPKESVCMDDGNYFLTSAQNNTGVHDGFLQTILQFCKENSAKLLVSKCTYKKKGFENLTSDQAEADWYDMKILPYLMNEQVQLGDFIFYGNFDILPTAVNPLSGVESHSGELDCAFPHSKLHMRPIATMPLAQAKHVYTTGTVTLRNYVQRKAGQKAELHHVFGGLFVKVRNGKAEVVPISAHDQSGEFSVYNKRYTPKGSKRNSVFAVNFGDIHLEKVTPEYKEQMINVMCDLKPKHVFLHDILDFEARNHHEIKDKYQRFRKYKEGKDSVEQNVLDVFKWLEEISHIFPEITFHVVPSNHNDAFYKWSNSDQPSIDYTNLRFWHLVNFIMLDNISNQSEGELLPLVADHLNLTIPSNVVYHERDESVRFFGIEYNLHGDMGANGSRGSPQGLAKLGFKANTGHTHSAGIYNGVYVAGVCCTLDHGYNKGLSGWSNSFVITYEGGKRTVITKYPDMV